MKPTPAARMSRFSCDETISSMLPKMVEDNIPKTRTALECAATLGLP
jgi:hypothetical protein